MKSPILKTSLLTTLLAASWLATAADTDRSEVLERIKPVGAVSLVGQPVPAPAAAAPAAKTAPAPAAEAAPAVVATAEAAPAATGSVDAAGIYQKTCSVCHAAGVANAPILGNKEKWAPHIAKGKEVLYTSSINGTALGMPPRGTCAACSDDDLKAVVDYMVSQSE